MNKIDLKPPASYDDDFALWSAEQAARLRAGKFDRLDLGNVAEEIESLGRSDKTEIQSRLTVILTDLLKWELQPGARSPSWASSIITNRDKIALLIEDSPSLRSYPPQVFERAYRNAPRLAETETELPMIAFPRTCPYDVDDVLNQDFWPGNPL